MEQACFEAVTVSLKDIFPDSTASTVSSMVIILVMEAGGRRLSASFSKSTVPVDTSQSRADEAGMSGMTFPEAGSTGGSSKLS